MSEVEDIEPPQVWALVPVKAPLSAKTRLAELLSESERAILQRAMLCDVLDQLLASERLTGVAIVCPDEGLQTLARARGVGVIGDEPRGGGLNAALLHGTEVLRASGADLVAILPADVPMIDAGDVDRAVLCALEQDTTVVVPDRAREGTNALVFRTDRAPRLRFGHDSCRLHSQDLSKGPVTLLPLKSIARDIDRPDDLNVIWRDGQGIAPNTKSVLGECAFLRVAPDVESIE